MGGSGVELRPMTGEEFDRWRAILLEEYAQERARNLGTPLEQERAVAARQFGELLPNGVRSRGHQLWTVTTEGGEAVGVLWVAVPKDGERAFIYDIAIDEGQRGKGYGRRTLRLLEEELRPLGVARIGLNVWGDNAVARRLYETEGYVTTEAHEAGRHMEKRI